MQERINTQGLDWKIVRSVIRHAIMPDANAPTSLMEAETSLIEARAAGSGVKIPAGTLQNFLNGKTAELSENVLNAVADALILEKTDFRNISSNLFPASSPHNRRTITADNYHKKNPFQRRVNKSEEYIHLGIATSRALSSVVRERMEEAGYTAAELQRELGLAPKDHALYNLLKQAATFDHTLQDRFVKLCATLNAKSPKAENTEMYLRDLINEVSTRSGRQLPGTVARLMEIAEIHETTVEALGNGRPAGAAARGA